MRIIFESETHIFRLYDSLEGIYAPNETFFDSIAASLRLKKYALVLLEECESRPTSTKPFLANKRWLWFSPRSLKMITETWQKSGTNVVQFHQLLMSA